MRAAPWRSGADLARIAGYVSVSSLISPPPSVDTVDRMLGCRLA